MKNSSIKKFIALRDGLLKEKAELTARLAEIEKALGVVSEGGSASSAKAPKAAGVRGPRRRARNELSLKEAALKVASGKAMTKQEILDGILKLGYVFSTKDPMNSLNVVLYSGKNFKRADGKFSAAK
ncbi:MAG TPA: hypothetical protein VGH19_20870 [Verrucomicrobiae bacterium]